MRLGDWRERARTICSAIRLRLAIQWLAWIRAARRGSRGWSFGCARASSILFASSWGSGERRRRRARRQGRLGQVREALFGIETQVPFGEGLVAKAGRKLVEIVAQIIGLTTTLAHFSGEWRRKQVGAANLGASVSICGTSPGTA
jgi:hypothetical protein